MSHCCEIMEAHANNSAIKEGTICYEASCRVYSVRLLNDNCGTHQIINYCPWCGTKLPYELGDKWFEILEKEYNLKDPVGSDELKVPEEFKIDAWWRKRGL